MSKKTSEIVIRRGVNVDPANVSIVVVSEYTKDGPPRILLNERALTERYSPGKIDLPSIELPKDAEFYDAETNVMGLLALLAKEAGVYADIDETVIASNRALGYYEQKDANGVVSVRVRDTHRVVRKAVGDSIYGTPNDDKGYFWADAEAVAEITEEGKWRRSFILSAVLHALALNEKELPPLRSQTLPKGRSKRTRALDVYAAENPWQYDAASGKPHLKTIRE